VSSAAAPKTDALDAEIAQLTLKSGDVRPAKPTPSPPPANSASPPALGEDGQPLPVEKPKAPVRQVIRKTHAPPAAAADAAAAAAPAAAAAAAADPVASGESLDLDGANLTSLLSTSKAKKPTTTSSMRSQLSTKKAVKTSILSSAAPVRGGDDDIDPFEAAAREAADSAHRAQREKEDAAARAAAPAPAPSPKPAAAEPKKREDGPDPNLAKYSKSTSISSDQYFERDTYAKTDEVDRARLAQFANANAIGSDAYFGHGDGEEDGGHYARGGGGGGDSELADAVAQTVQGIKGLAQGLFRGIQNRYG